MWRRWFIGVLGICLLLRSAPCHAEATAPVLAVAAEFTHTREVRDVAVVDDWIIAATSGGIAVHRRSDGRFLFKLTSRDGLPGNSMNVLAPLGKGVLAAGGTFGTAMLRFGSQSPRVEVTEVRRETATRFDPTFDIVDTEAGVMRLGFQSGLGPWKTTERAPAALGSGVAGMWRALARNENTPAKGAVAMGALDGRLVVRFSDGSKKPDLFYLTGPVQDIASYEDGFLIATGSELLVYEAGRIRPVTERGGSVETSVAATVVRSSRNRALIGTASGVVFEYTGKTLRRIGAVDGRVTAVAADDRCLWIGVAGKGLFRFDPVEKKATSLRPEGEICANHITKMTRHRGVLIAGSFDEGVCRLENGRWRSLDAQPSPYVHGVAGDGENLWVGTSSGLMRYDAGFVPRPLDETCPKALRWYADSAVTAVAEAGEGRVLLGSPWGAAMIHRKGDALEARFIPRDAGIPPHLTQVAAYDDTVFFGSESDGVRSLGPDKAQHRYLDPTYLPEAWVVDVAPLGVDRFWAATCQRGVVYVSGDTRIVVTRADGLSDNRTVAVLPFGGGAFVATLGGLSFVDTKGRVSAPVDPFVADLRGASLYSDGTYLWHGTESGLVCFAVE